MARRSTEVCSDVGQQALGLEQLGAALGLADALLVDVDVHPAGEQVLGVPFALAVAEQDQRCSHGASLAALGPPGDRSVPAKPIGGVRGLAESAHEHRRIAVVTGASSGIGAATARALAAEGFEVICAARRARPHPGSWPTRSADARWPATSPTTTTWPPWPRPSGRGWTCWSTTPAARSGRSRWRPPTSTPGSGCTRSTCIGTERVTRALLPALVAARGAIVFVTSIAADGPYEGGAGYCGAKAAERMIAGALRLELFDQPVRVTEISPGHGAHRGVLAHPLRRRPGRAPTRSTTACPSPLVADDVAEAITWMATRPAPRQHRPADDPSGRPGRPAQGVPRHLRLTGPPTGADRYRGRFRVS